jgi:hypothetical protein
MPYVQGREYTCKAGKQELEIEIEWIDCCLPHREEIR